MGKTASIKRRLRWHVDWQVAMPITPAGEGGGDNDSKLASVRGCQTERHNSGSTAAGDVIKVAAKLMQNTKKKEPRKKIDWDLIRNALRANHSSPRWHNRFVDNWRNYAFFLWSCRIYENFLPNLKNKRSAPLALKVHLIENLIFWGMKPNTHW